MIPKPKTQDQILSEFILSFSPQAIQQKQPLKGADPKLLINNEPDENLLINNEASVPRKTLNQQASQIVEETPPVTPPVTPPAPVIDENTVDFSSMQEVPMQQPVQQESQLRRLLTDPRTYETIANLGAAYSAYRGNTPLAQTLSGIAENIQTERVGREEAERKQGLALQKEAAQSKKDILKLEDDYRKEIKKQEIDLLKEGYKPVKDTSKIKNVPSLYTLETEDILGNKKIFLKEEQWNKRKENVLKEVKYNKNVLNKNIEIKKNINKLVRKNEQGNWELTSIGELLARGPIGTKIARKVGEEKQLDADAAKDYIVSNLTLDRLQQIRENSPTGGALGNVSDKDIQILTSAALALKSGQSKQAIANALGDLSKELDKLSAKAIIDPKELLFSDPFEKETVQSSSTQTGATWEEDE
jgi:hypothetical protein